MNTPDFTTAIAKAKIKRELAEHLRGLPIDAQRDVLADLILSLDAPSTPPTNGAAAQKPRPEEVAVAGRPTGAISTNGKARTEALMAALTAEPRATIARLAIATYGKDDSKRKGNVRALLHSLKKQGRVTNVGQGEWEAVTG